MTYRSTMHLLNEETNFLNFSSCRLILCLSADIVLLIYSDRNDYPFA